MAPTRLPRIFVLRHGQTEWSISGRHTGTSDIPLTEKGVEMIQKLSPTIVGEGKLIDPKHLQKCFISPRIRARRTFELAFSSLDKLPEYEIEELVREWDYGADEGLKTHEIRAKEGREKWDIWTDGCPGGESSQQMSDRVDAMIEKILALTESHHTAKDHSGHDDNCHGDILIVSHGHFSRCFLTRWCALPLSQGRIFVVETGAVSVVGYQHENFGERSLLGVNLFAEL